MYTRPFETGSDRPTFLLLIWRLSSDQNAISFRNPIQLPQLGSGTLRYDSGSSFPSSRSQVPPSPVFFSDIATFAAGL